VLNISIIPGAAYGLFFAHLKFDSQKIGRNLAGQLIGLEFYSVTFPCEQSPQPALSFLG
jgi:hypothetical protein